MANDPLHLAENLVTPRQLVERLPWLSIHSLRWAIRNADKNGLAAALIRPTPKKVLIDLDAFDAWLEARRLG